LARAEDERATALQRMASFLDRLAQALEALHEDGLVWLTFDPLALEEADGRLRCTNLDLTVYPAGTWPEPPRTLPAFTAPEICCGQDIGPRSDVFHLALFAYYWLADYLPHGFFGRGLAAFDFALPPLRTFAPTLCAGLATAVTRGLALDPAQ